MRSYATSHRVLRPPMADTSLVGAWTCEPHANMMVDWTRYAHGGTCGAASCVQQTILGPMRRYGPNSGVSRTVLGGANAFPLGNVTVEFWCRLDNPGGAANSPMSYRASDTDYWCIRSTAAGGIYIRDNIDNAGADLYTTPTPPGKLMHVVGVMDDLENLLYIDGNLVGSGIDSSDNWASFAGILGHGSVNTIYWVWQGIVGPLNIYNEAKSASWVAARYRLGAEAVQFRTTWGAKETLAASEGPGMYVGFNSTPFRVEAGLARLRSEIIDAAPVKYIEGVFSEVGNVVAVPTSRFFATPTEAAFGTWEFETQKGAGEIIDIAIIATSAAVSGYSLQHAADDSLVLREVGVGNVVTGGTATSDVRHRHKITRRFDGLFTCETDGVVWGTGTDLTTTTASHVVYGLGSATGNRVYYAGPRNEHGFIKRLGA